MEPSGASIYGETGAISSVTPTAMFQQQKQQQCNRINRDSAKVSHRYGWRYVVINFTPSWFSINMGTGIVSILLHNLPYNGAWLYWISVGIFCLNVLLFLVFCVISILRYLLFPGIWSAMIKHPVQSLFLGTFPMGLATIVNMVVFVCVPAWGDQAAILAWVLWWIDAVFALATNLYLPFVIMYKHQSELSKMTAAWLLPVVSTIVAAASGGIVAEVLPNDQHAIWTVTICYILWGCGLPLALFTMVIYFQRLALHALPPREVIVSVFLPLGPLGQGSFGIMQLGKVALVLFERNQYIPLAPAAGQVFYAAGIMLALVMWGFGIVWLFFALASISRSRFPFNIGWWGFTFPLGVFTAATTELAQVLPSLFFKVLGTIFSLIVVFLWVFVSLGTIRYTIAGRLLYAPCIEDWEAKNRLKDDANGDGPASETSCTGV
ncbi:sulfite efflux pump SSU1 [Xylariales sp. PMI_506]|nr:sulfite efflux pump SSU1 [Xylariales sp. PMI_506]